MSKNPNPLCLSCGKHTRTLSHHETNQAGAVVYTYYITSCGNVHCKEGHFYHGRGDTIGEARADYGRKYDENYDPI